MSNWNIIDKYRDIIIAGENLSGEITGERYALFRMSDVSVNAIKLNRDQGGFLEYIRRAVMVQAEDDSCGGSRTSRWVGDSSSSGGHANEGTSAASLKSTEENVESIWWPSDLCDRCTSTSETKWDAGWVSTWWQNAAEIRVARGIKIACFIFLTEMRAEDRLEDRYMCDERDCPLHGREVKSWDLLFVKIRDGQWSCTKHIYYICSFDKQRESTESASLKTKNYRTSWSPYADLTAFILRRRKITLCKSIGRLQGGCRIREGVKLVISLHVCRGMRRKKKVGWDGHTMPCLESVSWTSGR